jgi:hypothetical protein
MVMGLIDWQGFVGTEDICGGGDAGGGLCICLSSDNIHLPEFPAVGYTLNSPMAYHNGALLIGTAATVGTPAGAIRRFDFSTWEWVVVLEPPPAATKLTSMWYDASESEFFVNYEGTNLKYTSPNGTDWSGPSADSRTEAPFIDYSVESDPPIIGTDWYGNQDQALRQIIVSSPGYVWAFPGAESDAEVPPDEGFFDWINIYYSESGTPNILACQGFEILYDKIFFSQYSPVVYIPEINKFYQVWARGYGRLYEIHTGECP